MMQRVSRRRLRKIGIAVRVLEDSKTGYETQGGADLGSSGYHERRHTEAYTTCCDNVHFVSYWWDAYPIDVPTVRMESHGV